MTPIRSAADAFFHQDVRPGEVVCWPTNMGWMMGPGLVYAGPHSFLAVGLGWAGLAGVAGMGRWYRWHAGACSNLL